MLATLQKFIEAEGTRRFIIGVIVLNAIVLGLDTSETIVAAAGDILTFLDGLALAIFCVEILIKLIVYRFGFFKDPWNVFDFLIVGVSLVPASEGFSVLRAMRILRTLRLISAVPKMRIVIQALLKSVPAMGTVVALLGLVFYIASVMATKLYGGDFYDWFGTIGRSAYSLFQIMTLESWSMGIVRPVMEKHPYAWAFFVPFILVVTFAVLNLFIAIIVNSMQDAHEAEVEQQQAEQAETLQSLQDEIANLSKDVRGLTEALNQQGIGRETTEETGQHPADPSAD